MAWPFNSSNTAEESPAMTSNRCVAEKWRVSPAESSVSRSSLPSPTMRTRVAAEVETERSNEELAGLEEIAGGSAAAPLPASEVGCDMRIEVEDCLAARWAE
jgi:hypothetical protein